MSHLRQSPKQRSVFGDASNRANNQPRQYETSSTKGYSQFTLRAHSTSLTSRQKSRPNHGRSSLEPDEYSYEDIGRHSSMSPISSSATARRSAVSVDAVDNDSKRNSRVSTTSTNTTDSRRKTHIGPWQLGKDLGLGATARVRLARHSVTAQLAAVKIVQKKRLKMSQAGSLASLHKRESMIPEINDGIQRMPYAIEREVAFMKLIEHPNILKLYDIWENRKEIYLVLEYVDNGELFTFIRSEGRLEEELAMRFFRQILSAVGYCHSYNICHRDLKPENILLTSDGTIKIADFGMAALHQGAGHKLKTACGSPHYAAPEIMRGSRYRGDLSDIWSMGIVLYASLVGGLPFDADSNTDNLELITREIAQKVVRGVFTIPTELSPGARDLIRRILRVNPSDRLTIAQIWRHPFIRQYDYLDDFAAAPTARSPDIHKHGRPVQRRSDIDHELLRQLKSMWHTYKEEALIEKLINHEPNDQKLFYSLLVKYRDTQLENYIPNVSYSSSDYHHIRPLAQSRKLSTRQFNRPVEKGHARQLSRFTVVSNASETVKSYDPYKPSRTQNLTNIDGEYANIIVHRKNRHHDKEDLLSIPPVNDHDGKLPNARSETPIAASLSHQQRLLVARMYHSRSSFASSRRSRSVTPVHRAPVGHKRHIIFSRRKLAPENSIDSEVPGQTSASQNGREEVRVSSDSHLTTPKDIYESERIVQSRKQVPTIEPIPSPQKAKGKSKVWSDDVRQVSTNLAKDCDAAFNRSSIAPVMPSSTNGDEDNWYETSLSSYAGERYTAQNHDDSLITLEDLATSDDAWNGRPLPQPPKQSESVAFELAEARRQAEIRKRAGIAGDSPHYRHVINHLDRLQNVSTTSNDQSNGKRAISAPEHQRYPAITKTVPQRSKELQHRNTTIHDKLPLPPTDSRVNRIGSAPVPQTPDWLGSTHPNHRLAPKEQAFLTTPPHLLLRDGVRLIVPSSPSPAKPPAPLKIFKQLSCAGSMAPPPVPMRPGAKGAGDRTANFQKQSYPPRMDLRQQYQADSMSHNVPYVSHANDISHEGPNAQNHALKKKASNWFKRGSQVSEDGKSSNSGSKDTSIPSRNSSNTTSRNVEVYIPQSPKKKRFGFGGFFKRKEVKVESGPAFDIYDDGPSIVESVSDEEVQYPRKSNTRHTIRQIDPQQTWLAKLFHVKSATKFICFSVSKRRARQEIALLLREWRRYGMRGIVIDKKRNLVFGEVGTKNTLSIKGVAFAGEVMTVVEHGKRSHLSIARFTQEKGAASSFYKVVETLDTVLKTRGMLVSDVRKVKLMIKTLTG